MSGAIQPIDKKINISKKLNLNQTPANQTSNQNNNIETIEFDLTQNYDFTTYDLTEEQIIEITNLCKSEQATPEGVATEASLMANIFEIQKNGKYNGKEGAEGLIECLKKSTWWEESENAMENGPLHGNTITEQDKEIVRKVLVEGKRVIPKYVVQHDSTTDLIKCVNKDGVEINKNDPSSYIPNETVCYQDPKKIKGAESWIYYFHPNPSDPYGDPFGYYQKDRDKYGDFCYNVDDVIAT